MWVIMVCYGALKYKLLSNVQDNPDLQFEFKFGHDIYSSVTILDTTWRKSSFEAQAGFKDSTLCWSLKVHIHFEEEHWVQVTSGCIIFQVWLLPDRCLVGKTTEIGPVCSECLLASAHSRLTCSSPALPPSPFLESVTQALGSSSKASLDLRDRPPSSNCLLAPRGRVDVRIQFRVWQCGSSGWNQPNNPPAFGVPHTDRLTGRLRR